MRNNTSIPHDTATESDGKSPDRVILQPSSGNLANPYGTGKPDNQVNQVNSIPKANQVQRKTSNASQVNQLKDPFQEGDNQLGYGIGLSVRRPSKKPKQIKTKGKRGRSKVRKDPVMSLQNTQQDWTRPVIDSHVEEQSQQMTQIDPSELLQVK